MAAYWSPRATPNATSVLAAVPDPPISRDTAWPGAPGCPIEKLNPLETMWPSADTTR